MATRIEEFVAFLGWEVDPGDLEEFDKQVGSITDTFKAVTLAIGAATAALTAAIVVTNKQTAEMANLAKSVKVSTEFLLAMGGVVAEIGMTTDNVVDLIEEMNNKFGEKKGLKELTAVEEATKLLKLDFEDIRKLEPEKQFIKILDAAKKLEDQQQAVSAIDMLLGGEGNKITGFLQTIDGSMQDIIGRRLELNFLSQKGIDQAVKFNSLWGETKGVIGSVWAQFSGLTGGALTPLLEKFTAWVRLNRKLIQGKIVEWADRLAKAIQFVFAQVKDLIIFVKRGTDAVGGLENAVRLLTLAFVSIGIFKILSALQLIVPLILTAAQNTGIFSLALKSLGIPIAIAAIGLFILAMQDLYTWFQGGDTIFGAWGESLAEWADNAIGEFLAFFGISNDEFKLWLTKLVDMHSEAWATLWKHITGFFEEMRTISWEEVGERWLEVLWAVGRQIVGIFDWVNKQIFAMIDKIIGAFNSVVNTAKNLVRKLPFVGGAAESSIQVQGGLSAAAAAAGSVTAGLASRTINNSLSRTRGGDTRVDSRNTFNVSQRPGEDGQDFARRVVGIMNREMAAAVRNNDTGVTR
jgi:hypothetical protein